MQRFSPLRLLPQTTQKIPLAPIAVPAGFPSPATDYYRGAIDINQLVMTNPDATFMLTVSGHSMIGAGLHDGDKIIVDRSTRAQFGQVIVAEIDGEFTIKRLMLHNGVAVLQSENPEYPPIVIDELSELRVFGVVTWSLHHVD